MNLQALLVSSDDSAADVLGRVLSGFEIAMDRSSDPETTLARIQQQKFDALIVDFDQPALAEDVLREIKRLGTSPISVALVAELGKVRDILSGGAHFVLYKPVSDEAAQAGLRPAAGLLGRERRRAFRVPVQAPVEITLPDTRKVDGILLDISETGMDVLTAEPQVSGSLLAFRFQVPDATFEIQTHGQVAWANPNGQTGVRFLDMPEPALENLKQWLKAATATAGGPAEAGVPHCKLTDLSTGGCYVETEAPFPEGALIDFCLKTQELEVHTEAMVRVMHPGHGMGVEFPSRTPEQRAQVGNLIDFLRNSPDAMPELIISPRALVADVKQFEAEDSAAQGDEFEDPLLELLRRGATLQHEEFMAELQQQRN
ncbi:MAG TPA: PilZ domain-containing protein [Candidatus Sulfotelmatobacter sp.]|nr:PilZ domain-containing protein [Candidatus Sulfotelmatobacter sp.]